MPDYKRYMPAAHKPSSAAPPIDFTVLMTIYCDRERDAGEIHIPVDQYFGKSKAECREKAFFDGWIVRHNYTGTCPMCCKEK